jgi:hypothetical protein
MNMGVGRWFCNFQTYGVRVIQFDHFCHWEINKKFIFSKKLNFMFKKYILITIDIWHKIICKTSSQNKNKIIDICLNS